MIFGKFTLIHQRNHVKKVVAAVNDLTEKERRRKQFGRQRFSIREANNGVFTEALFWIFNYLIKAISLFFVKNSSQSDQICRDP